MSATRVQGMVITTPPLPQNIIHNTIKPAIKLSLVSKAPPLATTPEETDTISSPNNTPPSPPSPSSASASSSSSIPSVNMDMKYTPVAADTLISRKTEAPPKQRSVNGYVVRVGFDTLGCSDSAEYAFTLQAKTDNWRRTKRCRTFLVGTDLNEYSAHALDWTMENMVEDGDEIVALRVVPMELRDTLSKSGIPSLKGQESAARTEATRIMTTIREKNPSKQISIVVEYVVGNVRETIQHMIKMYKPAMLVVGTRGRNPVKGFFLGSISRYCLHHSPIPVIVVRPERKLNKSKIKAKGIFRRRSSVFLEMQEGFQGPRVPHQQQQGLHLSASDAEIKAGSSNNSTVSSLSGLGLQSATVAVGETPNKKNSFLNASRSATSSLFASLSTSPQQQGPLGLAPGSPSSSASSPSSSIVSLATNNQGQSPYSNSTKPPEGILKMKKSVTVDGGSTSSLSSKLSGRSFGKSMLLGPLSLGKKDKKDDTMLNRRASGG
ncbi:hypothetical protein BG005_009750 [Podila minutissima]|nr:hypothetical protein BG005_009750 [Podila minutissima]